MAEGCRFGALGRFQERVSGDLLGGAQLGPRSAHESDFVIDAVATNMMIAEPTREMRVPIGGIAHAGIRGISKVELP